MTDFESLGGFPVTEGTAVVVGPKGDPGDITPALDAVAVEAATRLAADNAESALARNANNLTSGTVPDARISGAIARTSALTTKADLVGGTVPASQLPSYVDDVLAYADLAAFPATGEDGKIYIAKDTNLTYRWGGVAYGVLDPSLALGETSSTGYRGDRGKAAYDHAQIVSGNPHGVTKAHVGLGSVLNVEQIPKSLVDAKGDLLVATADDTPARLAVGADGRMLMADSAAGPGLKWATVNQIRASIGLPPAITYVSGERFIPAGWQAQSTANLNNNSARLAPWLVESGFTLAELNAAVTTAGEAGSTFRFLLYADTGNCYPGSLVYEAGGLSTAAIGTVTTTLSQALTPGLYWLGGVCQNAATTPPVMTACSVAMPIPLRSAAQSPVTGVIGYFATMAGAAPATWTATVGTIGTVPRMTLKVA